MQTLKDLKSSFLFIFKSYNKINVWDLNQHQIFLLTKSSEGFLWKSSKYLVQK